MRIRPAVPADADGIGAVHVAGWRHAYRGRMPDALLDGLDPAARARAWRERLGSPQPRYFTAVAEEDGDVRGFVAAGPARGDEGDAGEVYAIYLDPALLGTGVGRALMEAATAALGAGGFARAILWVLDDNPRARRFYELAGWRTDGGEKTEEFGGKALREIRYSRDLSVLRVF